MTPQKFTSYFILVLIIAMACFAAIAQEKDDRYIATNKGENEAVKAENKEASDKEASEKAAAESRQKYRLMQTNGFLFETAYHESDDEMEHVFTMRKDQWKYWNSEVRSSLAFGGGRHQVSITTPFETLRSPDGTGRGFRDMSFDYSFTAIGSSKSRVTVSPTVGISVPTGNLDRYLGHGIVGYRFSVPASISISKHFAMTVNAGGEVYKNSKAVSFVKNDLRSFHLGQSFVWYAKPKFNVSVESLWTVDIGTFYYEPDKFIGHEHNVYVSPGFRWAQPVGRRMMLVPGIAFPIGVGMSHGNNGVIFSLAFRHPIRKEER